MSIQLIDNTIYGTYGQKGVEVVKELQTLAAPKSWQLKYIPEEGKFSILGCGPAINKQEIEAIFARRTNQQYAIDILESFSYGNRQFTLIRREDPPRPSPSQNMLRQFFTVTPGISDQLGISRSGLSIPYLPTATPEPTRPTMNPIPPFLGVFSDPLEHSIPSYEARGTTEPVRSSLEETALEILGPALAVARQLRSEEPAIQWTVSTDEVDPPLLEAMRRILSETSARINLVRIHGTITRNQEGR